ncbi:uncharacterized protein METZ01_LOCUS115071 [marine metagenome]|uniref:Uncharacterized protein n=1 Tax=marine metagenome TaxID=408172 RepID=A0A381XDH1_9ZZZZ
MLESIVIGIGAYLIIGYVIVPLLF